MSTAVMERLPNTVTRCHEEIRKLREAAIESKEVTALKAERDELKERLEATEKEVEDLEERVEELEKNEHPDVVDAVGAFLDECERIGPMRYDVPQSDRSLRAIVRLHDSIGRAP